MIERQERVDGFNVAAIVLRGVRYTLRELNNRQAVDLQAVEDDELRGLTALAMMMANPEGHRLYAGARLAEGVAAMEALPVGVTQQLHQVVDVIAEHEDPEGN